MASTPTASGPAAPGDARALLHGAAYSVVGALLLPLFVVAASAAARLFGAFALAVIPMAALGTFVGKGVSLGLGREGALETRYCAGGFALAAFAGMLAAREGGGVLGLAVLAIAVGAAVGWVFAETTASRIAVAGCAAATGALIAWLAPPSLSLAIPFG